MDVILVLNAGSSSLKFQIFSTHDLAQPIAIGRITGIGSTPIFSLLGVTEEKLPADYDQAQSLQHILSWLAQQTEWKLCATGHRIVHGGVFSTHQILTDDVIAVIKKLVPLAPLHQPYHLQAIALLKKLHPNMLQVGCFDTVFHARQKPLYQHFALPQSYFDEGVRRYGFHGLSYEWTTRQLKLHHSDLYSGRIVAAHLGNGASLCAINNGQSVATTMGMTAIEGLPMGTRSGEIDPGAILYLIREKGMSAEAVEHLLSYQSGLMGLSALSNDMRDLRAAALQNPQAQFAIDYFTARVAENIAKMAAVLGGMDALVFTGGVGENDKIMRDAVKSQLSFLSKFEVLVIPANEEALIAETTLSYLD